MPSLIPGAVIALLAESSAGSSFPFGFSDIGWILAAAAVVLVLAVVLQALVRKRRTSPRPQPQPLGSRRTDP